MCDSCGCSAHIPSKKKKKEGNIFDISDDALNMKMDGSY